MNKNIIVDGIEFAQAMLWWHGELIELEHVYASRCGKLYRVERSINGRNFKEGYVKQTLQKCSKSNRCDYNFKYNHNGRDIRPRTARVIASTFIKNPDPTFTVNHRDENPLNNNVDNLEWMSLEDNILYSQEKILEARSSRVIPIVATVNNTQFLFKNQHVAVDILKEMGAVGVEQATISKCANKVKHHKTSGKLNGHKITWKFCEDKDEAENLLGGKNFIRIKGETEQLSIFDFLG